MASRTEPSSSTTKIVGRSMSPFDSVGVSGLLAPSVAAIQRERLDQMHQLLRLDGLGALHETPLSDRSMVPVEMSPVKITAGISRPRASRTSAATCSPVKPSGRL